MSHTTQRVKVVSESLAHTRDIATGIVALLKNVSLPGARVVLLRGELGSGKTSFVSAVLRALGMRVRSASPTFVIIKRYRLSKKYTKNKIQHIDNVYHLDAYRLSKKDDLATLGVGEILKNRHNLVFVEWPERVKGMRWPAILTLSFQHGKKENERIITIS